MSFKKIVLIGMLFSLLFGFKTLPCYSQEASGADSSPISKQDDPLISFLHDLSTKLSKKQVKESPSPVVSKKNPDSFINPEISGDTKFEIYFNPDDVFPAVIVSLVELGKKTLALHPKKEMLGSFNGAFSILAQGSKPNTGVKVTVFPNRFIADQTVINYTLPDPNFLYDISPLVAWDFQKLTGLLEPTNETFKIGIQVDGQEMVTKIFQPRIRSINDSIYSYTDRYGNVSSLLPLFSAFVNENDPIIDEILKEAKELGLKAKLQNVAFTGYQWGQKATIQQVALLWFLFQSKHFVYSNITQESGISSKVLAQHVRSLEDSYSATQANCVDGSVLFASILKKIGIKPYLVIKPGHCYLMFLSEEGKGPCFIETTMLGWYQVKNFNFFHPASVEYQNSYQSFNAANQHATSVFNADYPHYQNKESGYSLVDIDACRAAGITPINK